MEENNKTAPPPEKLLKKKCPCGQQLTIFSIVGLPFLPEWMAVKLYTMALELDRPKFMPGMDSEELFMGIAFTATCTNCGNITAWSLDKDELDYLTSDQRDSSYGIAWLYNPDFLKRHFASENAKSIFGKVIATAEIVEKGRLGFEAKGKKENEK